MSINPLDLLASIALLDAAEDKLAPLDVLLQLNCSICKNLTHPPIHQCTRGHTLCTKCFGKITLCPCNDALLPEPAAHLEALHHVHKLPCQFWNRGCLYVVKGPYLRKHEKRCKYGDEPCPVHPLCTWKGRKEAFVEHSLREHPENVTREPELRMRYKIENEEDMEQFHLLFDVHGELFRCSAHVDKVKGVAKWCVYFLGDRCWSDPYLFELLFGDVDVEPGVRSIRASCVPFCASGGSLRDEEAVLTDVNMLRKYVVDGHLMFTVKIKKWQP